MQASTTRLKKPLHIWLARILGFGIVLMNLGTNAAALPEYLQKVQQEGVVQDFYHITQPDGTAIVNYVYPEAIQKGIAVGDRVLNPKVDTLGEIGTPVTLRVQRDNAAVREVTFIRKPADYEVWAGMVFGLSQGTSTSLVLLFRLAPLFLGGIAALFICWLKSDDWMALLTGIFLSIFGAVPNTYAFAVIFSVLITPLILGWFILFPNGRLAPRWSWLLVLFVLPQQLLYSLSDLGILSDSASYNGALQLAGVLAALGGLGVVGMILFRYRRIFSPVERQQSKWIILPLAVSLAPSVILTLVSIYYWNSGQYEPSQKLDFVNTAMGLAVSILLVLGVLFSIFNYRLWDVDTVVSRAIVYSSLTGILALIGFIALPLINYVLEQALGEQSGMLAILVSALPIAALFNPVREWLQQTVDRRFKPEEMDFENTFIEFTSELRSVFTLKELSSLLARHAVEQLDVAYASVFLSGQDGQLKHITTVCADQEATEPRLDDKMIEKIRKGQLASFDDDFAQSLVVPLVVPRSRKPTLSGALILGPRLQGVGYSTAIIKSLKEFGEEVGKAFYAAEVKSNKKQTLLTNE